MRVTREMILSVVPNHAAPQHVADILTSNLERFHITNLERLAAFLAQIAHESGFAPVRENLMYRNPWRLKTIFPSGFKDLSIATITLKYVGRPVAIANRAYGTNAKVPYRLGNGDEASGDGWRYRGGGVIQITGLDNFKALSVATGIDYIKFPDKITELEGGTISGMWWWDSHGLNALADVRAFSRITRVINGPGMLGEANRERLWNLARIAVGLK
jgi:putative chitinase